MQRGSDPEDPRGLFEDYLSSHVTVCPEPGPCQDEDLLRRGAEALLEHPVTSASLIQLCYHVLETLSTDHTDLRRLVRATELLETLCLNLYFYPWRKDIRKLKSFTGAFVYCLLPALGCTTLQSLLASIGYMPEKPGPSPSDYRLFKDASLESAVQVAFELLLTRALCLHLLQQHSKASLQECVDNLKLNLPAELSRRSECMAVSAEREENQTDADPGREVCPEGASGLTDDQPNDRLHLTYTDLVFRGRPLQEDDTSLSPQTDMFPLRRRAQRAREQRPPSYRPRPSQDLREDDGLSGPLGLSLHITSRPQTGIQWLRPDQSGLSEENAVCEMPKRGSTQDHMQDQTTSVDSSGEDSL
ncbi:unnamed protein product [Knipowitschia caucasica]|uniref:Spermatogenesis-associated protein 2 PUB-like domain-containing protein n=1 Tax=Knipowitschia caucasica TaxID=637954 RepID=A0AAV2JQ19_KNICA